MWDSSSKRQQGLSGSETEWINRGPSPWCLVMTNKVSSPGSELENTELGEGLLERGLSFTSSRWLQEDRD